MLLRVDSLPTMTGTLFSTLGPTLSSVTTQINASTNCQNCTANLTSGLNASDGGSAALNPQQVASDKMRDEILYTLHGIIFVLAVVGNGLVITTLAQNKRMRTITNIFLLNLAVADLLLAIVCMPFTIIPFLMNNFIFGLPLCILIRYLQGVTVSASAFTLVAISIERFYAICNPLKSRRWQSLRHSYKVLLAIWLLSLTMNIPMAIFQTVKKTNEVTGVHQCLDKWPKNLKELKAGYYIFQMLVADLLVPLMVMSIAYGFIAKTLWNNLKAFNVMVVNYVHSSDESASDTEAEHKPDTSETLALQAKRQMSLTSEASDISDESEHPLARSNGHANPSTPTSDSNSTHGLFAKHAFRRRSSGRQDAVGSMRSHSSKQNLKSKKRVIKMLFVIVVEFFVCWTPLYIVMAWIVLDTKSARAYIQDPTLVLSTLRLIAYVSSCCNPITYCFMSKKFRTAFLTAFRCKRDGKKALNRRATLLSTQVSYCDGLTNQSRSKFQLSLPSKNKLAALPEASTDNLSNCV